MSRVSKGRRKAYDNIAVGSAITSVENTIPDQSGAKAGAAPPADTTIGNGENIQVATDYGEERHVSGSLLMEGERLGA